MGLRKIIGLGGNQARVSPREEGEKVLDLYVDDDGTLKALTNDQVRDLLGDPPEEAPEEPLATASRHRTGGAPDQDPTPHKRAH